MAWPLTPHGCDAFKARYPAHTIMGTCSGLTYGPPGALVNRAEATQVAAPQRLYGPALSAPNRDPRLQSPPNRLLATSLRGAVNVAEANGDGVLAGGYCRRRRIIRLPG